VTSEKPKWVYGPPMDTSVRMLLLTKTGIECIGCWHNTYGMIAHSLFPQRDMAMEETLHIGR